MSKKKNYFIKKVKKIPLYVGRLVIIATNDKKKAHKKFPDYYDRGEEPYAHAIRDDYKGWNGFYIILNFDHSWSKITHGVISHEAHHITSFIAETVGIRHDPTNDEPMAYLHNWVVDQVYKFVKEQGFKVHVNGR